jgi:hypothetical protein
MPAVRPPAVGPAAFGTRNEESWILPHSLVRAKDGVPRLFNEEGVRHPSQWARMGKNGQESSDAAAGYLFQ